MRIAFDNVGQAGVLLEALSAYSTDTYFSRRNVAIGIDPNLGVNPADDEFQILMDLIELAERDVRAALHSGVEAVR